MSRRWAWVWWLLALAPGVAGILVWVRSGKGLTVQGSGDRWQIRVSAVGVDWAVAGAVGSSLLLGILLCRAVIARARNRRMRRVVAQVVADEVERAGQRRRLLLSRLDHELKNPLTALRAATANVSDTAGLALDDPARAALGTITDQVLRLSRLTRDLRKLVDLDTVDLELSPFDLKSELAEAAGLVKVRTGREIQVNVHMPAAPGRQPVVRVDRDLLRLALGNLLDNAVKFTEPGERIWIRGSVDAARAEIVVNDNGRGIPEDELEAVWEELYRCQRTRYVPGSGLGLPFVKAIVARHGGEVEAKSHGEGHGSSFHITLPVAKR